jgi:hypothetical protein
VSRNRREADGRADDGGLTDANGNVDQDAVKDAALPVLERWSRERTIDRVRRRLGWIAAASAFVVLLGLVTEPPGLTGLLLQVWTLASVPIGAIAAALYATVRNPRQARDVWWDSGLLVTVGLISMAVLAQSGQRSAYGRAAWQLLFGDDSPSGVDYGFTSDADDDVDLERVAVFRKRVRTLVGASLLVAGLETTGRLYGDEIVAVVVALATGDGVEGGGSTPLPTVPFIDPSNPVEYLVLVLAAAVVGVVVGFFVAIRRDL